MVTKHLRAPESVAIVHVVSAPFTFPYYQGERCTMHVRGFESSVTGDVCSEPEPAEEAVCSPAKPGLGTSAAWRSRVAPPGGLHA